MYVCMYVFMYVHVNPLKSELFRKLACRDAVVVYSLFFSPTTYTSLYSCIEHCFMNIELYTLCMYVCIYKVKVRFL